MTVHWPDSFQESGPLNISCHTEEEKIKKTNQKQLQDKPKDQSEKLDEINLDALGEELRPGFTKEMKEQMLHLLRESKMCLMDVCANVRPRSTTDVSSAQYQ